MTTFHDDRFLNPTPYYTYFEEGSWQEKEHIKNTEVMDRSHIDAAKQHNALTSHHGEQLSQEDYNEGGPVMSYTHSAIHVNNYLRAVDGHRHDEEADDPESNEQHESMQRVFKATPNVLDHDVHVYHGTTGNSFHYIHEHIKPGQQVSLSGYTSTTIRPRSAISWSANNEVIHFHVKKGSKAGLYLGGHSHYPKEKELLLDHGTKATYVGTTHQQDMRKPHKEALMIHHFEVE